MQDYLISPSLAQIIKELATVCLLGWTATAGEELGYPT
jgi:hypothetical protein